MMLVFWTIRQSVAKAAEMAIDGSLSVQEIPYEQLRERLRADGQVLRVEDARKNWKTRVNGFRARPPRG